MKYLQVQKNGLMMYLVKPDLVLVTTRWRATFAPFVYRTRTELVIVNRLSEGNHV